MTETKQTLGNRRNSTMAYLQSDRLQNAFWIFWGLRVIWTYLKPNANSVVLSASQIRCEKNWLTDVQDGLRKFGKSKSKAIVTLSQESVTKILITHHIIPFIADIPPAELHSVPVQNYATVNGWDILYGDGGRKCNRQRCATPPAIFNALKQIDTQHGTALERTQTASSTCPQSPYKGNQNTESLICCADCALTFLRFGLKANQINDFLHYIDKVQNTIVSPVDADDFKANAADAAVPPAGAPPNDNAAVPSLSYAHQSQVNAAVPPLRPTNTATAEAVRNQFFDAVYANILDCNHNRNETFQSFLMDEESNDTALAELAACRTPENTPKATAAFTAGLIAIFSCDGRLLLLRHDLASETHI